MSELYQIFCASSNGHGSVLFLRCCNTLCTFILMTMSCFPVMDLMAPRTTAAPSLQFCVHSNALAA